MVKIHYSNDQSSLEIDSHTLEGANLAELNFHRALLNDHNLKGANLHRANLRGCLLNRSDLSYADLSDTPFMVSEAKNSNFSYASLVNSRPISTDFTGSDFSYADLTNADVDRAIFQNTKLIGTKMLCLRIDTISLQGAVYNNSTQWTEGFDPESKGAINIEKTPHV